MIGKFQNILRKISKTLDMLGSCAIVRIVNKTKQNQRSLETKQHENKNKKVWNIPEILLKVWKIPDIMQVGDIS